MSIFGSTRGTELECDIAKKINGEEKGAVMYAAMAYLAAEKGLHEAAELLMKTAVDELRHAGFYAVLNGVVEEDLYKGMTNILPLEAKAETALSAFAELLKAQGMGKAAEEVKAIAKEESDHAERLQYLIEKART